MAAVQRRELADRISANPDILGGKPVVDGTRVPVYLVLRHLAEETDFDVMFEIFPHLTMDDIKACLRYAADLIDEEGWLLAVGPATPMPR